MKLDEMNPAPPVTSTRFGNSDLPVDRVQRSPLDVALDPREVLADERQDEPLDPEHEQDSHAAEERPREVRLVDPEHDPVDPERQREQRADDADGDADPLDRLRPESCE